jgi:1,4-alpha-glucan branching enzyme
MKSKRRGSKAGGKRMNTVCFEFDCGNARAVGIAGTFNDWNPEATPMLATGAGRWTREVALRPGRYEYQYVVDGIWMNDPRALKSTPNPRGGRSSVIVVEAKIGV